MAIDNFTAPIPDLFLENNQTAEWARSLTLFLDDISRADGVLATSEATAITVTTQEATIETLSSDLSTVTTQVNTNTSALSGIQNSLPAYSISNDGTVRTLNADDADGAISPAVTQAEVENIRDAVLVQGDVLATLIRDLKNKGILGV